MKLNQQDSQVIEDAVRLLKSQFVPLYTKLGYDIKEVSEAWHNIRVTPTGQVLMEKFRKGLPLNNKASSFVDADEEVGYRQSKKKKK